MNEGDLNICRIVWKYAQSEAIFPFCNSNINYHYDEFSTSLFSIFHDILHMYTICNNSFLIVAPVFRLSYDNTVIAFNRSK